MKWLCSLLLIVWGNVALAVLAGEDTMSRSMVAVVAWKCAALVSLVLWLRVAKLMKQKGLLPC